MEAKSEGACALWQRQLVEPLLQRDPVLQLIATTYAMCPDRYELETRLIVIERDRVQSDIPGEDFALIVEHYSKNQQAFDEDAVRMWYTVLDLSYPEHLRKRVQQVGGGEHKKQKVEWVHKQVVLHKDFRVVNRPLGIRVSLKLEIALPPPAWAQRPMAPMALKAERAPACSLVRNTTRSSFREGVTQIDLSVTWQARDEAKANNQHTTARYQVEVELCARDEFRVAYATSEDVVAACERARCHVGTLLLRTMQLIGLDRDVALIPLI